MAASSIEGALSAFFGNGVFGERGLELRVLAVPQRDAMPVG
jgi:hypothetical protein